MFERGLNEAIIVKEEKLSLNRGGDLQHHLSLVGDTMLLVQYKLNTIHRSPQCVIVGHNGYANNLTEVKSWYCPRASQT